MPCGYITIISVIYSQLARAKSENLDNIYSSRRRQRWRTVKKTTIGLISNKATLHVQHTFLYISLPLFCPPPRGGTPLYELYQVRYVPPHRDGFCAVLVWKRVYTLPILIWIRRRCRFRGNYRSVWTYLSFQFQMSKKEREICEFEMDLKNLFACPPI